MAGQAVVGYACEFVDTIPKELQTECSICLHILRDPHMVDCCGYRFCKACIERVLAEFNSCPLCNHRQPKAIADRQLSRTLREKRVRCSHKGKGCKWVGELYTLDDHLDATRRVDAGQCKFKLTWCRFCSLKLRYDELENHESKCHRKTITCEYCNIFQCLWHELPQHWDNCSLYPVICLKGCGAKITRASLEKHYKNWCPLSIVECEFAYAGCKVRVQRKHMKTHLDEAVKDHLDALVKSFSSMKIAYQNEQALKEGYLVRLEETEEDLEETRRDLEVVERELVDARAQQRDWGVGKDQEIALLKRLCALRQHNNVFDSPRDQVLVYNLPSRTTEQMLRSIFGQHGLVFALKLYSGYSPIAVVEYQQNESVFRLFQKHNSMGIRLLGHELKFIHLKY